MNSRLLRWPPNAFGAQKRALQLIRKAERVSSLLNDVVGDIVGVVGGSAGSVIALYLAAMGLPTAVASRADRRVLRRPL